MIDQDVFDKQVVDRYNWMKGRFREKKWKSGKRAGMVKVPRRELPFGRDEFARFLWKHVGLNAFLCPYCRAPIDILSMTLDHKMPVKLGGSLDLDNLEPICADCNNLKGALTVEEFIELRRWLSVVSPNMQAELAKRLKAGAMGMRMRHFDKKPAALPSFVPPARQVPMDLDNF